MLNYKHIIVINILLSILLLVCLFDMPYGYYQLVRFVATAVFGLYAYHFYEQENKLLFVLYLSLALLFQPFMKITLGRTIWNIVDVIIAAWLLFNS
ncbi:MAG: hypothetical protein NZM09_02055, partial [Ignavibacterium sp.]|nr:hypothetical protein [Ignavibacterium sp.]MDW8374459.1 hypothetical protein [Ignavibacteriales bacterium]